jgi:hypothetical protein
MHGKLPPSMISFSAPKAVPPAPAAAYRKSLSEKQARSRLDKCLPLKIACQMKQTHLRLNPNA